MRPRQRCLVWPGVATRLSPRQRLSVAVGPRSSRAASTTGRESRCGHFLAPAPGRRPYPAVLMQLVDQYPIVFLKVDLLRVKKIIRMLESIFLASNLIRNLGEVRLITEPAQLPFFTRGRFIPVQKRSGAFPAVSWRVPDIVALMFLDHMVRAYRSWLAASIRACECWKKPPGPAAHRAGLRSRAWD